MTIREKRPCIPCDKEVEIVEEATEGDVVHQKLSCGHTSKRMIRTVQENLSLKELVSYKYGSAKMLYNIFNGFSKLLNYP